MLENDDVLSDSSAEVENIESGEATAAPESQPVAKPEAAPFHEHPRFQELVSQKNQFAEQVKQLQAEMASFKASQPKAAPERDELMERLKGIDPAFADRFGKIGEVDKLKAELEEVRQWRAQQSAQTEYQSVQNGKEKFYADNKVPAEHRELYEAQLIAAAQANPNLKTTDLPQVMKAIHEKTSKLLGGLQRSAQAQLVTAKKADGARPATQPKGQMPGAGKNEKGSMSKAQAKEDMISKVLAELRAGKPENH
jgi:uncharacterized protein YdcH (DUF465 family)